MNKYTETKETKSLKIYDISFPFRHFPLRVMPQSIISSSITLYASGILTVSPLAATNPTMPDPQGIRISSFIFMSAKVL